MTIRRTRYYTVNYQIFHRDKNCSYLKQAARVFSFLEYEPISDEIEFKIKYNSSTLLYPCTRCGKQPPQTERFDAKGNSKFQGKLGSEGCRYSFPDRESRTMASRNYPVSGIFDKLNAYSGSQCCIKCGYEFQYLSKSDNYGHTIRCPECDTFNNNRKYGQRQFNTMDCSK